MGTEKDHCLAAEALVWEQKNRCQERPMVSFQFELVKTILLLFTVSWMRNIYLFAFEMMKHAILAVTKDLLEWKNVIAKTTFRLRHSISFAAALITIVLQNWIRRWDIFQVGMVCKEFCWREFCLFTRELFAAIPTYPCVFDSTLGYPGEGWRTQRSRRKKRRQKRKEWSKKFANLTMATWNTRSMTSERFEYCKSLGYDILAVTELWRTQDKFTTRTNEFIVSATVRNAQGDLVNSNDGAAGVGILLSKRAQCKVKAKGNNNSERICWVRIEGPVCNLFVVAVYVPHSSRVSPSQTDTMQELDEVCKQAKQGDCIVVLGDFNAQLPGGIEGHTGAHVCAQGESESATEVLNFMKQHDLSAMNTKFRKRNRSPATYLRIVSSGTADVNDQHVGREVKETWKGKEYYGKVLENHINVQGGRRWKAKFEDGYVKSYSEQELLDAMVIEKKKTEGRQLDYILVSNRWSTSVQDAGVRWGPSEHRNIAGRADHALVYCRWTWKLQTRRAEPTKDYSALNPNTTAGKALINKFDNEIKDKLRELPKGETPGQQYKNLCAAIAHASHANNIARQEKGDVQNKRGVRPNESTIRKADKYG